MKLRDKDTKKYLLTVFVATFVAYIIPPDFVTQKTYIL